MKKLFLTLAVLFSVATIANAQDVGKIWVGGSVSFKSEKTDGFDRTNNYRIIPEIGYVVSDKLGVGIKLGYGHFESTKTIIDATGNTISTKSKENGFTVNPFVRYSVLKGNIGGLFVDGGVGYSYLKEKGADNKLHQWEVGFRPGVAVNVSDQVSLTGKFGFLGYENKKYGSRKTNSFGFDFDMTQVELGVNFVF